MIHKYWEVDDQLKPLGIKREYVQLTGDLKSASLLARLLWWYKAPRNGKTETKLQLVKDGYHWRAHSVAGWMEECALSRAEFYAAVANLTEKGLVVKAVHKFAGNPSVWMRLDLDLLFEQMVNLKSELPLVWKSNAGVAEVQPDQNPNTGESCSSGSTTGSTSGSTVIAPLRFAIKPYENRKRSNGEGQEQGRG